VSAADGGHAPASDVAEVADVADVADPTRPANALRPLPDGVDVHAVVTELLAVIEAERTSPTPDDDLGADMPGGRITVRPDGTRVLTLIPPSRSPAAGALSWAMQRDLRSFGVSWTAFVRSPRGQILIERALRGDLGDATSDECRTLLVAVTRQERFCDGATDSAIRSGFVSAVLRRLLALHPPLDDDAHATTHAATHATTNATTKERS